MLGDAEARRVNNGERNFPRETKLNLYGLSEIGKRGGVFQCSLGVERCRFTFAGRNKTKFVEVKREKKNIAVFAE